MSYDQFFQATRRARKAQHSELNIKKELDPRIRDTEQELRAHLKVRPAAKKASFPVVPLLFLAFVCTLLGWWSVDPLLPERILGKLNIQMMGAASAENSDKAEKKSEAKDSASAKKTAEKTEANKETKDQNAAQENEDLSHLEKLRERKTGLDQREKELNELEEELHKQKAEIESRIKQLEELRAQITTLLKDRVEVDQERVMKLVETYSNMKPKQAAEILSGVDEDLAVEVLGKMKKKNAAEIMNLLEPAKARTLSEKYAGYKAR